MKFVKILISVTADAVHPEPHFQLILVPLFFEGKDEPDVWLPTAPNKAVSSRLLASSTCNLSSVSCLFWSATPFQDEHHEGAE